MIACNLSNCVWRFHPSIIDIKRGGNWPNMNKSDFSTEECPLSLRSNYLITLTEYGDK